MMSVGMSDRMEQARLLREQLLQDPYRPGYHFAVPGDIGQPGDPNGAFFASGRYHLMYLYRCRSDGFRWGHISSADLLHWRAHPDALSPDELDGGIFSGGAFVDDDGTAYLTYWALPVEGKDKGGIRLAKSHGPAYEVWEKLPSYALACTENGVMEVLDEGGQARFLSCADPSNIWKKDGRYYIQAGNLCVLQKYKRDGLGRYFAEEMAAANAPSDVTGDWTDLFSSDDLLSWRHHGRFYARNPQNTDTFPDEDNMCPSFLPLPSDRKGGPASGRHLELFISHNRGCQYYIGRYDRENDAFLPETHGRMTWADNFFFAPEALVDENGRQIMWSWLQGDLPDEVARGWSGVFCLPRTLWLAEQNGRQTLGIAPACEIEALRGKPVSFGTVTLDGVSPPLTGIDGLSCEITCEIALQDASAAGFLLRADASGQRFVRLFYDKASNTLTLDPTESGASDDARLLVRGACHDGTSLSQTVEKAPLSLAPDEKLSLRVFVDKSVIEVFANDRQALCRQVFIEDVTQASVFLFSTGGPAEFSNVTGYTIAPTNFY